jgi:hypothetical protein
MIGNTRFRDGSAREAIRSSAEAWRAAAAMVVDGNTGSTIVLARRDDRFLLDVMTIAFDGAVPKVSADGGCVPDSAAAWRIEALGIRVDAKAAKRR